MRLTKIKLAFLIFFVFLLVIGTFFYFGLKPPQGRVNFLVLGMAGGDHPGRDLTDTMMFVSLDRATAQTWLVSLPRDVWLDEWQTKLNTLYHYRGLEETKKTVAQILGQPVDYGLVVDFDFFVALIDFFDGVEVMVTNSFDDERYPIPGKENDLCEGDPAFACRYEHLHFDAGPQLMDGATALKYVRSRFAAGDEGTDFARSERQQQVFSALKNELVSWTFLSRPWRWQKLFLLITGAVKTDMPVNEYWLFFKTALRFRTGKLTNAVLGDNFFENPPPSPRFQNQWVLVPKNGDWGEIRTYVEKLIVIN